MPIPYFNGEDVAFAKNKVLPIVVCVRQDNSLVPLPLRGKGAPSPPRGLDEHDREPFGATRRCNLDSKT
jgi:hypothetical protein